MRRLFFGQFKSPILSDIVGLTTPPGSVVVVVVRDKVVGQDGRIAEVANVFPSTALLMSLASWQIRL